MNAGELDFVGSEAVQEEVTGFIPDFSKLGPAFKAQAREVGLAIKETQPRMSMEDFAKVDEFVFTLESGEVVSVKKEYIKPKTGYVSRSGEKGVMLSAGHIGIFVLE